MDKQKSDGSMFRDRAFSNVYVCEYDGNGKDFNFDKNEVTGLVKVNAQDTLDLINGTKQSISSTVYKNINNTVENHDKSDISIDNFLVNKGETAIEKYGDILTKVIDLTK